MIARTVINEFHIIFPAISNGMLPDCQVQYHETRMFSPNQCIVKVPTDLSMHNAIIQ